MRFKTDENTPPELADLLRAEGYDALTIWDQRLTGSHDADILAICSREDRVFITLDLDFADIRAYPPASFPGIIVLRLERQSAANVLAAFHRILPLLMSEPLSGRLWVVDELKLRIRGDQD